MAIFTTVFVKFEFSRNFTLLIFRKCGKIQIVHDFKKCGKFKFKIKIKKPGKISSFANPVVSTNISYNFCALVIYQNRKSFWTLYLSQRPRFWS